MKRPVGSREHLLREECVIAADVEMSYLDKGAELKGGYVHARSCFGRQSISGSEFFDGLRDQLENRIEVAL
jgi:hypothetical protein